MSIIPVIDKSYEQLPPLSLVFAKYWYQRMLMISDEWRYLYRTIEEFHDKNIPYDDKFIEDNTFNSVDIGRNNNLYMVRLSYDIYNKFTYESINNVWKSNYRNTATEHRRIDRAIREMMYLFEEVCSEGNLNKMCHNGIYIIFAIYVDVLYVSIYINQYEWFSREELSAAYTKLTEVILKYQFTKMEIKLMCNRDNWKHISRVHSHQIDDLAKSLNITRQEAYQLTNNYNKYLDRHINNCPYMDYYDIDTRQKKEDIFDPSISSSDLDHNTDSEPEPSHE
jgi:hypothetical protein